VGGGSFAILVQTCGLKEPAFVCSLRRLTGLVAENPFGRYNNPAIRERCISFFDVRVGRGVTIPLESERRNC
jgi:hypothetical protein